MRSCQPVCRCFEKIAPLQFTLRLPIGKMAAMQNWQMAAP